MNTSQISKTNIEPKAGSWILLIGPRSMNATLLTVIARWGGGAVCVLDGSNCFDAYTIARVVRGQLEVLNCITVSLAFTCHQVLSLLESTLAIHAHIVTLDLLNIFYYGSAQLGKRKRLLCSCLPSGIGCRSFEGCSSKIKVLCTQAISVTPHDARSLEKLLASQKTRRELGEYLSLSPAERAV